MIYPKEIIKIELNCYRSGNCDLKFVPLKETIANIAVVSFLAINALK
jgi:hypothetical protein